MDAPLRPRPALVRTGGVLGPRRAPSSATTVNRLLQPFLDGEVPTLADRIRCAGVAHNVFAGPHRTFDTSGNAFALRCSSEGVRIGHRRDDTFGSRAAR